MISRHFIVYVVEKLSYPFTSREPLRCVYSFSSLYSFGRSLEKNPPRSFSALGMCTANLRRSLSSRSDTVRLTQFNPLSHSYFLPRALLPALRFLIRYLNRKRERDTQSLYLRFSAQNKSLPHPKKILNENKRDILSRSNYRAVLKARINFIKLIIYTRWTKNSLFAMDRVEM